MKKLREIYQKENRKDSSPPDQGQFCQNNRIIIIDGNRSLFQTALTDESIRLA